MPGNFKLFDQKTALVSDFFHVICNHLRISNRSYFGLCFTNKHKVNEWLDNFSYISKYIKKMTPPYQIRFCVRFYPVTDFESLALVDSELIEMQIETDLSTGKILCQGDVTHSLLAHVLAYHHNSISDPETILDITTFSGISNSDSIKSEYDYLKSFNGKEIVVRLISIMIFNDCYGHEVHLLNTPCFDNYVVLCPKGIILVKNFLSNPPILWTNISSISHSIHKVIIEMKIDGKNKSIIIKFGKLSLAKNFYRCALAFGQFYYNFNIKPLSPIRRAMTIVFSRASSFDDSYLNSTESIDVTVNKSPHNSEIIPRSNPCDDQSSCYQFSDRFNSMNPGHNKNKILRIDHVVEDSLLTSPFLCSSDQTFTTNNTDQSRFNDNSSCIDSCSDSLELYTSPFTYYDSVVSFKLGVLILILAIILFFILLFIK
uniref:FERM, ARHGEF and pleckstrin domain-containing protein 1 (Trinotate prediction) n=1 Tax=Myxobolus squamalis TaxID=59785 RepID=A0A6B2FZY9_MYXSQ